jgi:competence protein ComEC
LGARFAVISVGADNDYGHPAPETVSALASTDARVLRTDRDGSIAVVEDGGRLTAVTRSR